LLPTLLGITLLIGISFWVWRDAGERGMSRRWAIGTGLLLIVVLPLYLLVRRPKLAAKCTACGNDLTDPDLDSVLLCEACRQAAATSESEENTGREGRIFG
jgi:hypothetical protein